MASLLGAPEGSTERQHLYTYMSSVSLAYAGDPMRSALPAMFLLGWFKSEDMQKA